MNDLNIQIVIDDEIAEDFRESFSAHYHVISRCIMNLDGNSDTGDSLEEIFRSLHSIKGNANMCQLDELTHIAHALENIASAIRDGALTFTPVLGEIILLTLDKIREISEELFEDNPIDNRLIKRIVSSLHHIQTADDTSVTVLANQFVQLVAGHVIDSSVIPIGTNNIEDAEIRDTSDKPVTTTINTLKESLNYFCHLSNMLDAKLPYRKGRIQRVLPLALRINESVNDPVDPVQLEGAVYMHDIAFAFLSDGLILTDAKFTGEEMETIRKHPRLAADFMRQIPGWDEAATMVWQHHEWWNGQGYPKGIREQEICTGARILAIVDAYESMTHPRPDRQYKRSVLRAITEINNFSGKQFSPEITRVFNDIVRQLLARRK